MKVFIIAPWDTRESFKTRELAEKYCDLKYKDYPELKDGIKEIEVIESLDDECSSKS